MKIASIVGARPQFIKLAPFVSAIVEHINSYPHSEIEHIIIHTGQHYDYHMDKIFFDELGIPAPKYNLGVGSGTHGQQTGKMIARIEEVLLQEKPVWTLVYGDTNSTLAGAIAAAKLRFPLAHIESGLRSYNRTMPEETNRILTDHCADVLFCPTKNSALNLKKEGFSHIINKGDLISDLKSLRSSRILSFPIVLNVGDIMYDALLLASTVAGKKSKILSELGLKPKKYYLATLHRAENTDDKKKLQSLVNTFAQIHSKDKPLVFAVHPRTANALKKIDLYDKAAKSMMLIDPPLNYFDMLIMEKNADKILTDSGGIQKEAYFFNVPCITLRTETEWTETTKSGLNIVSGTRRGEILSAVYKIAGKNPARKNHFYGTGKARKLILNILLKLCPL